MEAERHLLANVRIAAGLRFGCPRRSKGAAGEQVTWSAAIILTKVCPCNLLKMIDVIPKDSASSACR